MTTATTLMPTRDVTIGDTFVRISGQGFPLVFVHGFTTTSEFWREQAEEFSNPDQPARPWRFAFPNVAQLLPRGFR
jgi:pimeloyl-ACP methyl ester carboxylesterase